MSLKYVDYNNPNSMGSQFRVKRIQPLIDLIERIYQKQQGVSILDQGGKRSYWNIVPINMLRKNNVTITLLNLPATVQGDDDDVFTHVTGDACNCELYRDNEFDIVHSNSAIEHVGNWEEIKAFAEEAKRLAPFHFIQTPYFWFPVEPHFIRPIVHWLPRPWRAAFFLNFRTAYRSKASTLDEAIGWVEKEPYLLDQKTFRLLFPSSTLIKERYFMLVKSHVAFRGMDD